MIDSIKNDGIDVEKVEQLFNEILGFLLDNRGTFNYERERVQIADKVFNLTQEIIELMYRTELYFLNETTKSEAIDILTNYKQAEIYLNEMQTRTDILQS